MPLADGAVLHRPEAALLKWERKRIDIGQFCCLRRDTSNRSRKRADMQPHYELPTTH